MVGVGLVTLLEFVGVAVVAVDPVTFPGVELADAVDLVAFSEIFPPIGGTSSRAGSTLATVAVVVIVLLG